MMERIPELPQGSSLENLTPIILRLSFLDTKI